MTNGQTYYYHTDALGSVIAITDSNRNVVQRYEYDSFGNIVLVLDPNFIQPYTYTGREYDPETGLYYYRARYYDAEVGRFISEDPIGIRGGDVNYYAYTGNSPLTKTDPEGTLSLVWPGTHYCGFGANRPLDIPSDDCVDEACRQHDICYKKAGVKTYPPFPPFYDKRRECDEKLCKDILKCKNKTCLRIVIADVFYCSFLGK